MYSYTINGSRVDYSNPAQSILIEQDFYHRLINIFRFSGDIPWSVAQHSLLVYYLATIDFIKFDFAIPDLDYIPLQCLLHDFHEALIGDIPTPLKVELYQIKDIEHEFDIIIYDLFNVKLPDSNDKGIISTYDKLALIIEGMYFGHPLIVENLLSSTYQPYRNYIYDLPQDKINLIASYIEIISNIYNSSMFKNSVTEILRKETYGQRITC